MRDESVTSQELIHRAQQGDRGAFDLLVERHRARLESLVEIRVWDKLRTLFEPEDILQETLLRAHRSLQDFEWRGKKSFFLWMAKIAEHVILDLHRRNFETQKRPGARLLPLPNESSRSGERTLPLPSGRDDVSPSRILRRKERLERLKEALGSLSADHREVIYLSLIWGLPPAQVGERMGRSAAAASMLLLRALRALRKHFDPTESLRLPALGLDSSWDRILTDVPDPPPASDSKPTGLNGFKGGPPLPSRRRWPRRLGGQNGSRPHD